MNRNALRAALLVAAAAIPLLASGSSHREAPFIAGTPRVDGTDFYMFRSYEPGREDYVTLIANYLPLQDAYGGPNYFALDEKALYEIHIDNNGDAREDITFQFRFDDMYKNLTVPAGGKNVAVPLVNIGQVDTDAANLNMSQSYSVAIVRGNRRGSIPQLLGNATSGGDRFQKPADNIGNKSIPDYASYAGNFIYSANIPGCSTPARVPAASWPRPRAMASSCRKAS